MRWPEMTYCKQIVSNSSCYQPDKELVTNICVKFLSVKTAPTQECIHLISLQFEFLMKEVNILYFNWLVLVSTLETLISPYHKYLMSNIEQLEILIYPKKFVTPTTKFLKVIHFFLTSKLIEIKQYQSLQPTVEFAKLNMGKDQVRDRIKKL